LANLGLLINNTTNFIWDRASRILKRGTPWGGLPKWGYPEDPGCPEFTGKLPGQPRIANLNSEYESDRSLEDRGAPGR